MSTMWLKEGGAGKAATVETNIVQLITTLNKTTRAMVRKGSITRRFHTLKAVIQGCPQSPHLFNIYLKMVMQISLERYEERVEITEQPASDLFFPNYKEISDAQCFRIQ